MKNNLNLNKIDFNKFAESILALLKSNKPKDFLFADIVSLIQKKTGIESIGLRIRDGFDFPYYVTRGFSQDFIEKENFLCVRDKSGSPVKDPQGLPKLECMCGDIIRGRTDSSLPHFTKGGSFWTNSTTDFIASQSLFVIQDGIRRNRCNREGYESVALIPVREKDVYGLLQLNDSRKNLYTLQFVELMEWVALSIAILITYVNQQENTGSIKDLLQKYQPSRVIGPIKTKE